jgi:predicted RNase H-like HicB family nuclease
MNVSYTAIVKQDSGWWIGWIEEVPGVNSQGATREELLANLRSALREALAMNREEAVKQAEHSYEEEPILL